MQNSSWFQDSVEVLRRKWESVRCGENTLLLPLITVQPISAFQLIANRMRAHRLTNVRTIEVKRNWGKSSLIACKEINTKYHAKRT